MQSSAKRIDRDAEHVRGILRRTSVADYLAAKPHWQTVLDYDALAKLDNQKWVQKGRVCLYPGNELCLVELSAGGEDAITLREFNLKTGKFVEGGFMLPRSKQSVVYYAALLPANLGYTAGNMATPSPSPNWQKTFADCGLTLTPLELNAVNAAYANMTQPDASQHGKLPYTKEEYPGSPFGKLESDSATAAGDGAAYALDPDAFQIIRYHNSAKEDKDGNYQQWLRFGLQRRTGNDFSSFTRPNMFQYPVGEPTVNLAPADATDVARRLNQLWSQGQRVVALLGAARMKIEQGMELIEPVQQLVADLSDVAYVTGGYRGESGNSYGVTRAGFDVPKSRNKQTLVIMCRAGIADAHQTADAMSIFGRQWGDDTPALSTASDAAVFIRHIPAEKVYGKWTEVEIANFVYRKKPLVILDPLATASEETHFGAKVPIFKRMGDVAAFLRKSLPTPAIMQARQPLYVKETTMVPLQQFEKYMAVRLYFEGNEYAMGATG
jgi:hypothetical protein